MLCLVPRSPAHPLTRSLKPALSPFNLHSVLSCDQKAGAGGMPSKGQSLLRPLRTGHARSHGGSCHVPHVDEGLGSGERLVVATAADGAM